MAASSSDRLRGHMPRSPSEDGASRWLRIRSVTFSPPPPISIRGRAVGFGSQLAKNSTPATKLSVKVVITFDKREAGWAIARSEITVRGEVPGIDEATFARLAEAAKDGCPVSGALKGNVELSVDAKLA